ncbi:MAG: UDP-N-acetylmuramoyl-L-alanine--D-glutamate ligase [Candidatus Levybacteria bacterium]|nr:UDP-N-acetylmuramoyl-L-alanine--D-glutamate ligase [Candidatus Levybacteria bacterium]
MDFKNKNVAVLGFGAEGASAVNFMLGHKARVSVFDVRSEDKFDREQIGRLKEKGVEFRFDKYPESFSGFDYVVRSPGIRPLSQVFEKIKKEAITVTSATKIFFDLCPSPIIGVTGTKGKGTTSTLIYEMLKKQGHDVYLGGNIGLSPLEFLSSLKSDSWVVLELSSFQLQDLTKSPKIAVVLMVTSEHLDYHRDVPEYVDAKRNILRFQSRSDFAILNRDYPASNESDIHTEAQIYNVSRERGAERGCYVREGFVVIKPDGAEINVIPTADILLPGKHNFENACAATMAAYLAGVEIPNIATVLKEFKGLEHRLELVRVFGGVRYYDDSFSTIPETAIAAIEAFEDPEILILGGSSKNSDFTELGRVIREARNIKAIIGIGEEWPRILAELKAESAKFKVVEGCANMEEIVRAARELAEVGDVVILSPACASFDMFPNYKERGNQFKEEVSKLS